MKFVARLRFNIVDGLLVEAEKEHCVLIPVIQESSKVDDLTEVAKQYIYDHVEICRLHNDQRIILLLAGNLEYLVTPEQEDWVINPIFEWSSLEIIPMGLQEGSLNV